MLLRYLLRPAGRNVFPHSASGRLRSRRNATGRARTTLTTTPPDTGDPITVDALSLRDACACSNCVDASSGQKLFGTQELKNVSARSVNWTTGGSHSGTEPRSAAQLAVEWSDGHHSRYPLSALNTSMDSQREISQNHWAPSDLPQSRHPYADYESGTSTLLRVLHQLHVYGLAFLKDVPSRETAVLDIIARIGPLKNTFYGPTWDVRSVKDATNIAYTAHALSLHMDLLYLRDPPGLQVLHCLENSAGGGASTFADAFRAADKLSAEHRQILEHTPVTWHYENEKADESYRATRPVLSSSDSSKMGVDWSPPFQAPFAPETDLSAWIPAARAFAQEAESPDALYTTRMAPGDCVIFDNRRVLHGREAFDLRGGSGSRWLKGAYVDTDVWRSRYNVLRSRQERNGRERTQLM